MHNAQVSDSAPILTLAPLPFPQALGHDPAAAEALEAARAAASSAVRSAKERVEALSSSIGSVDFSYRDPERGWDRGRVKGVLARLVRVQRPEAATALEVAAGGRLYQVGLLAGTIV